MALAYLLDPCLQHQNRAGVNNVDGWFEVFRMDTDDRATIYTDFNGTLAPARNVIDNNGRVVMIAESGVAYRVAMYLPNGELVYTQQPVFTVGSGGGTGVSTEITSSDGSINVDKITGDYETTFDITVARDGQDLLEYVRCDGATQLPDSYIYLPTYTEGTIAVGEKGLLLSAGNYYHVTAHVRATKSVQRDPYYDEVNIRFVLDYGTAQTDAVVEKRIVDYSLGLSQEFEVSTDVMPSSNCELLFVIDGQDAQNGSFQLLDVEAHRVYSGSPSIPSGVLSRVQAREIYQPILTAGENITIENNVISATGGGSAQVQSDWTESDTDAKSFIRHKPHTKPVAAGDNIVIKETSTQFVISATAEPQEQANWAESDSSSVQYIQNKPDLSVYATTQAMNTALAGKQDVISDLATIRSGAALGATATQPADLAAGLATKQDVISDLATIRSGAALGTTSVQPADLAPYATTADMNTALAGKQDTLTAGSNISIVNNVISATAAPQQQADWEEGDPSSVQYIQHKPDLSVYATDSELTAGLATKQDVISDLATIRSGAALGTTSVQPADLAPYATTSAMNTALAGKQDVISDLSDIRAGAALGDTSVQPADLATVAESGNYEDLNNKPDLSVFAETSDLATVALTGSYADLSGTPTIPTATSDLTNDSNFITRSEVPVKDVQVDGTSVVNAQGIAEISIPPTGVLDVEVNGSSVVDAQGVASIDLSGYATTQALTTGLATKQDTISDLATIRSGASAGASAVQPGDLATVAVTGSYADLTNTPSIPTATSDLTNDSNFITLADVPAQVQANWTESDSSAASYITNKPQNLVQDASYVHTDENFTSAEKTKLSGIESGAQVNTVTDVEVDGVSVVSQGVASITLPSVPVQDVTVNGTSVVSNGTAAVDLSNYATTQALTTGLAAKQDTLTAGTNVSLTNNVISATDTTYTAGTGIDITSGAISVENPLPSSTSSDEGKVLKVDANGDPEWSTGGGGGTNADWTESDPTAPSYIENKPTPKTLTAGANISISEGVGTLTISAAAGLPASTSADEGKCLVVDSNGDPEWGTGGKTYTGTDGVVVDNVNDTVGLEAPVDMVAGPGIAIDNPDGNTVRVSLASTPYNETVLWEGNQEAGNTVILSESSANFERLVVYVDTEGTLSSPEKFECLQTNSATYGTLMRPGGVVVKSITAAENGLYCWGGEIMLKGTSCQIGSFRRFHAGQGSAVDHTSLTHLLKVVGINRIANN